MQPRITVWTTPKSITPVPANFTTVTLLTVSVNLVIRFAPLVWIMLIHARLAQSVQTWTTSPRARKPVPVLLGFTLIPRRCSVYPVAFSVWLARKHRTRALRVGRIAHSLNSETITLRLIEAVLAWTATTKSQSRKKSVLLVLLNALLVCICQTSARPVLLIVIE